MCRQSQPQSRMPFGVLVLLVAAVGGCHESAAPAAPTMMLVPPPAPAPTPAPPPPTSNPAFPSTTGSLSGVVTERTPTGSTAAAGVTLGVLSCARAACPPGATSIYQDVTTGPDGTYRVAGLYDSEANYIWVERAYVFDGAPPAVPCEGCDLIATVNGETRLDLNVLRR